MKKILYLLVPGFLVIAALSGCGGGGGEPGSSALLALGGAGSTGAGGTGGRLSIRTTGSAQVLASGTVDATFVVSAITASFGANPVVVSGGTTTVQSNTDAIPGGLYTKDGFLYQGDGNGKLDDPVVTGLTVAAGATLVLVDQQAATGYGTVKLSNDLVINGTITTDASTGLYIDANLVDVENSGKITTSSTVPDANAKEIHLGSGQNSTKQIINRGTIEAKGSGSGNGGSIFIDADDLAANYGTINTSGGSSDNGKGGNSGRLQVFVNYGNFYSSGTILANGGNGGSGSGGNGGNIWIETAPLGIHYNMNGDIIISGAWEMNGGNGMNGDGGNVDSIGLQTDAMGSVLVNATLFAKGGNARRSSPSGTACSGGIGGSLSMLSNNASGSHITSPGKIRVSGQIDVSGGNGDLNGGPGGSIAASSRGGNAAHKGIDVEFVGFPTIVMNGGDGLVGGGSGSNPAFYINTCPPEPGSQQDPSINRQIRNEATIQAKGGNAAGSGGAGGYLEMNANTSNKKWHNNGQPGTPASGAKTVVANLGNIDVSGGNGETGGSARAGDAVYMEGQRVANTGNFTARGGNGTLQGGNGGDIDLFSDTETTYNTGAANIAGGSGGTTSAGIFYIDGIATN
jgi:hypothetical protein